MDYTEKTIICIEKEDDGEKVVHFMGYGYYGEVETEKPYRFLEYTFFFGKLKNVLNYGGIRNYEGEYQDRYKQYITDCTYEEMNEIYEQYNNGKMPEIIDEKDITINIPFGCYIVETEQNK